MPVSSHNQRHPDCHLDCRNSAILIVAQHCTTQEVRVLQPAASRVRAHPCYPSLYSYSLLVEPSIARPDDPRLPRPPKPVPSLMHVMVPQLQPVIRGYRPMPLPGFTLLPHPSSPELPSLHRHYPTSSLLRTSPPPRRPSLTLAGCRLACADHRRGFPCCCHILLHTCRRQYPGGTVRCSRCSLPVRCQPPPC